MVNNEGVAASSGDTGLPSTSYLVASVPVWSVSEYCIRHGRMLGAHRFERMFSDGQIKSMVDSHGMHNDTDIDAWEQRWASMRQ